MLQLKRAKARLHQGLSSIEPNKGSCQMNSPKEVDGGFVVAFSDGAVLLQSSKEVLNQMAGLIQMPVIVALDSTGTEAGNHHRLTSLNEWRHYPNLSVVGLVRNDQIGRMTRREVKTGGVAQRIHRGMDFGAQPAAAASDAPP